MIYLKYTPKEPKETYGSISIQKCRFRSYSLKSISNHQPRLKSWVYQSAITLKVRFGANDYGKKLCWIETDKNVSNCIEIYGLE